MPQKLVRERPNHTMTMPIHEVAVEVLREFQRPMTADEIYEAIVAKKLYTFKAQSPKSVLRSQLRRHCFNVSGPNQASHPKFKLLDDNRLALL